MLLCIGHSTVLRILPFRSLNRRICGSLTLAKISQGETSHIPRALSERIFRMYKIIYTRIGM